MYIYLIKNIVVKIVRNNLLLLLLLVVTSILIRGKSSYLIAVNEDRRFVLDLLFVYLIHGSKGLL